MTDLEKKLTSKQTKILNLVDTAGLSPRELNIVLNRKGDQPAVRTYDHSRRGHFKIGIISDTHIGHKKFDEGFMKYSAEVFRKEGIKNIYHAGDITEGMSGRPGHVYELQYVGFSQQVGAAERILKQYFKKFNIYGITGNHDDWYKMKNDSGANVGEELAHRVPNFTYLGENEAVIKLGPKTTLMLFHANDGTAYATCFDDKTEIMTENGWRLFKDLSKDEKVATLSKDNKLEWQQPTNYTDEEYEGNMLHFSHRTFDLLVTPNHRMLVRRYLVNVENGRKSILEYITKSHRKIEFNWKLKEAQELADCKRQEWQMRRGGQSWNGTLIPEIEIPYIESKNKGAKMRHIGKLPIDDVSELIAWYVTEGCINKKNIQLTISQSQRVNKENHEKIVDLFRRIGFNPTPRGRDLKDITVCSKELCLWLKSECASGSRNIYLPKWLKDQPTDILKIVFDTMIEGDGWYTDKGYGYKSISKRLRNDLSEVAIKLGLAVTEHGESLSITKEQIYPTINTKPLIEKYNGQIYCVSVPNGIIMVRRNGRNIWSGNSYKMQKLVESLEGGSKPNILVEGHYHKAMYMFNRNIHTLEAATLCGQTGWMRGKKIPAHKGFWVLEMDIGRRGITKFVPHFYPAYD